MRIAYFGTPQFSADVLHFLIQQNIAIVGVVTRQDKPKGRTGTPLPSPVKQLALEKGLPLYQPGKASSRESLEMLATWNADLFVIVAFGEILSEKLLDLPLKGCINLHTSLLPKYRGAAPIQQAIIHGEVQTGVSIMHLVKAMDAGDIIFQCAVPIEETLTFGALEARLCTVGAKELVRALNALEKGCAPRIPQDHTQATFAKKIELEDCSIQWDRSAQAIHNLVRGVNPYPGAWTLVKEKEQVRRLKIWETEVVQGTSAPPGSVLLYAGGKFIVQCGKEALKIHSLQLEGKKRVAVDEFIRGRPQAPNFLLLDK